MTMKLFSYVVTHDTGFSPNPFHGYCTLACCKPAIRRTAQKGDWIIGLTAKSKGNRIVYMMQVDEVEGLGEYWFDRRFERKKPQFNGDLAQRCGDNIYEPKDKGRFHQIPSLHSDEKCIARENAETKIRDLSGRNVLISESFAYFGDCARDLPRGLRSLIVERGHRCRFSEEVLTEFISFVKTLRFGVYAAPTKWKTGDDSWKRASGTWLVHE